MNHIEEYHDDCVHIQQVAKSAGYDITLETACAIWDAHSDAFAAGWLFVEDDAYILDVIDFHINTIKVCPHCGQRMEKPKDV